MGLAPQGQWLGQPHPQLAALQRHGFGLASFVTLSAWVTTTESTVFRALCVPRTLYRGGGNKPCEHEPPWNMRRLARLAQAPCWQVSA